MIETLIEIAAYALKTVGVVFLVIAAIGVLRLPDAFTRMHAATKAGTLGAGLVMLGSALSVTGAEAIGTAVLTVLILLATVPLASHLLGRAAYTSGAPFWQGTKGDALAETLPRGAEAGIDTGFEAEAAEGEPADDAPLPEPQPVARIVVAPGHREDDAASETAVSLAARLERPLVTVGVIDTAWFAQGDGRIAIARERLQTALERVGALTAHTGTPRMLEAVPLLEGEPEDAFRRIVLPDDLVVMPGTGWFDHGAGREPEGVSGRAERLLPLARTLMQTSDNTSRTQVLLAGTPRTVALVTVFDDGGRRIERVLAALASGSLFGPVQLRVAWRYGEELTPQRRARLERIAAPVSLGFTAPPADPDVLRDPGDVFVCTALPGPARADWYGQDWHDRIAPGWRGHVLLV